MNVVSKCIYIGSALLGVLCLVLFSMARAATVVVTTTASAIESAAGTASIPREKPAAQTVKGVYLTAYTANNPVAVDRIIKLIDTTELNAVVVDIKDYSGFVLYASEVPLVKELHTAVPRIVDVPALIKKFHDHHIYVIARQTVFQDPLLARGKLDWAIHDKRGGVWYDNLRLPWVDPTRQEVWKYNVAIAREAISFGFDEINFDYVRFPSDGDLSRVVYKTGNRERYEIMRDFYTFISTELSNEPAWLSFDMFGFVLERFDGMSIGQRVVDAADVIDYISPMMYPSHYPSGHLGFKNPAEHPGAVIEHGLKLGSPLVVGQRAQLRPWLQAFHLGARYDAAKIRAQIDMTEKYTSAGWLLWNPSNRYTTAGLRLETSTEQFP